MMEYLPYPREIIQHFRKPKNMGRMKNFSGLGKAGNLLCGDILWLYIKVKKDPKSGKEIISDASFETFGCVVAIGISSILTEMIKGKTLEEALKIRNVDLLKRLSKKLPPIKVHCSILAAEGIHEAIYDYYVRSGKPVPEKLQREHESIQKVAEELERRHKEYIELEKEVLRK